MKRAAIYARRSDKSGSMDSDTRSVPLQIKNATSFIGARGWSLDDARIYQDEFVHGDDIKRLRGRARLIADAEAGKFDVLVCRDVERFSREDTLDALNTLMRIKNAGVDIWYYSDGTKFGYGDGMPEDMMAFFKSAAARDFKLKSAKHTANAMREKAKLGHCLGSRTLGYDSVSVNGHQERRRNPAQSKLVLDVWQRAATGRSCRGIAVDLNAAKVHCPNSRSGKWSPTIIHDMLHNDIYRGVLVYNKTYRDKHGRTHTRPESEWIRTENDQLRIVSEDLWRRVHDRLDVQQPHSKAPRKNGKGIRQRYLLSGFCQCVICGGGMILLTRRDTGHGYKMVCGNHWNKGKEACANNMRLDAAVADRAITDLLRDEVLKPSVVSKALDIVLDLDAKARRGAPDEAGRLKKELARVEKDITKLTAIMMKAGPVEHIIGQLTKREADRRDLKSQLTRLASAPDASANPASVRRDAMKTVTEWQTSLTASDDVLAARGVLDAVLTDGRIQFKPVPATNSYDVSVSVGYGQLLQRIIPAVWQVMTPSPRETDHNLPRVFRLKLHQDTDGRRTRHQRQRGATAA